MSQSPGPSCGCDDGQAPSCAPKLALSLEEEEVLGRMRAVVREARELKSQLRQLQSQLYQDERMALERQLERQRGRFRTLKEELRRANRAKLIRLGHQP